MNKLSFMLCLLSEIAQIRDGSSTTGEPRLFSHSN